MEKERERERESGSVQNELNGRWVTVDCGVNCLSFASHELNLDNRFEFE